MCLIGKALKLTGEQKFETALEILRTGIGRPPGKPDAEAECLRKHVADPEQLADHQAMLIRVLSDVPAPPRSRNVA